MTEDDRLLLHAMLDGELDAPAQRVLEQRLQSEPDLAMAFAALRKLQGKLRALPIERSSDSLRARVETLAPRALVSTGSIARPRSVIRRRSFSASSLMAASVAALFLGATFGWIGGQGRGSDIEGALVASHVRGLIAARPFDVASSDQHTVRPWFAGKLAVAPFVADLASASFPLEGGRIDVIDGEPEPTLLYRRGPPCDQRDTIAEQDAVACVSRTQAWHCCGSFHPTLEDRRSKLLCGIGRSIRRT